MKPLTSQKNKSLKLSKQASGTLEKVIQMIENDQYCPEVIQQVDSVVGLLTSVKRELLTGHLDSCLETRLKQDKSATISELLKIYKLTH